MLEKLIVEHGAPTLARLKVGNLIQIPVNEGFEADFAQTAGKLGRKGIKLLILKRMPGKASVYVYRPDLLQSLLNCPAVRAFLNGMGYDDCSEEGALKTLEEHMRQDQFPHEVGIFLGYPLSDVQAFIQGGDRKCVACGCWKAYSNECEARRIFALYRKCTEIYARLYNCGRPIEKLAVA